MGADLLIYRSIETHRYQSFLLFSGQETKNAESRPLRFSFSFVL